MLCLLKDFGGKGREGEGRVDEICTMTQALDEAFLIHMFEAFFEGSWCGTAYTFKGCLHCLSGIPSERDQTDA